MWLGISVCRSARSTSGGSVTRARRPCAWASTRDSTPSRWRDGRWLVVWRDPSGRQRKKSFARKTDAQRWSDQMQAASHRGQFIDPVAAKLKVGGFAQTWMDGMAHLKPPTAARYASIVRVHIDPH